MVDVGVTVVAVNGVDVSKTILLNELRMLFLRKCCPGL